MKTSPNLPQPLPEAENTDADSKFHNLLVCPSCRGGLLADCQYLTCGACSVRYPIIDGIPHLVSDSAEPLE
ncbi:MAG: Trm112 family protein [Gammaproteobacteria bacterium]